MYLQIIMYIKIILKESNVYSWTKIIYIFKTNAHVVSLCVCVCTFVSVFSFYHSISFSFTIISIVHRMRSLSNHFIFLWVTFASVVTYRNDRLKLFWRWSFWNGSVITATTHREYRQYQEFLLSMSEIPNGTFD